jgi:hypothetical protein
MLTSLSACVIHPPSLRLQLPEASAPFRERRDAFLRSRPEGMGITEVWNGNRMIGAHQRFIGALRLADGTLVRDPEMLLSAVNPGSATELSVFSYQRHRRFAHRSLWIGRGLLLGAIAMFAVGIAADERPARNTLWLSSGGLFLGFIGARISTTIGTRRRERDVEAAFRSFDADMADHLDLCVENENVRSCP